MCRKLALAATAVMLMAGPALAETPLAPKVEKSAPASPAAPPKAPVKATRAQRELIERDTPMARAEFWGRETGLDPADADAGLKFAAALRALGSYKQAVEAADAVTIQHPDSAEAFLAVAKGHVEAGDGFFAISPARRAQTLAPRDWRPLSILGVAYEQNGQEAEAIAAYDQALALSPDNPDILTNFALLRAGKGDLAQAEALLRKALTQPRVTARTRQNLANLLGRQGRLEEARQLMIQDLPPDVVENNLAWLRANS